MKFDKNSLNVGDIVTLLNGKQFVVTKIEWLPSGVVYVYSGNDNLLDIYSPASGDCLSRWSSCYDIVAIGDVSKNYVDTLQSRRRAINLINERFDHLDEGDLEQVEVKNDFDKLANKFCEFVKMTRGRIDEFASEVLMMKISSPLSNRRLGSNNKSPANIEPDSIDVTVEEGKYRFLYVDGELEAFKYGERWPSFEESNGYSKAIFALVSDLHEARIALENAKK